jgi:hypothetical protein
MWLTWLALAVSASLLLWSQRSLLMLRELAHGARERARELGQGSAHARIAELNELTIDLRGSLALPGFVARRCGRAALATGTLVALIQVARNLSAAQLSLTGPLLSFSCGAVAMVVCAMIGRMAEAEARGLRQHWNSLIRRSGRDVATQAPGRFEVGQRAQGP